MGATESNLYFHSSKEPEEVEAKIETRPVAHENLQFTTGAGPNDDEEDLPDAPASAAAASSSSAAAAVSFEQSDRVAHWYGMHRLFRQLDDRVNAIFKYTKGPSPNDEQMKLALKEVNTAFAAPDFAKWFRLSEGKSTDDEIKRGIVQSIWESNGHTGSPNPAAAKRAADYIGGFVQLKSLREGERKASALILASSTPFMMNLINRQYLKPDEKVESELKQAILKSAAFEKSSQVPAIYDASFIHSDETAGQFHDQIQNAFGSNFVFITNSKEGYMSRQTVLDSANESPEDLLRSGMRESFELKAGMVYYFDGVVPGGRYEYTVTLDAGSWGYVMQLSHPRGTAVSVSPNETVVGAGSAAAAAKQGTSVSAPVASSGVQLMLVDSKTPIVSPGKNKRKPASRNAEKTYPFSDKISVKQMEFVDVKLPSGSWPLFHKIAGAYNALETKALGDRKDAVAAWIVSELFKGKKSGPFVLYDSKEKPEDVPDATILKSALASVRSRAIVGSVDMAAHLPPILPNVVLGFLYAAPASTRTAKSIGVGIAEHVSYRLKLLKPFYRLATPVPTMKEMVESIAGDILWTKEDKFQDADRPKYVDLQTVWYGHPYVQAWFDRSKFKTLGDDGTLVEESTIRNSRMLPEEGGPFQLNPLEMMRGFNFTPLMVAPSSYLHSHMYTPAILLLVQIYGSAIYEVSAAALGRKTDKEREQLIQGFLNSLPRRLLLVPYDETEHDDNLMTAYGKADTKHDASIVFQQRVRSVCNLRAIDPSESFVQRFIAGGDTKEVAENKQAYLVKLSAVAVKLDEELVKAIHEQMGLLNEIRRYYLDNVESAKPASAAAAASAKDVKAKSAKSKTTDIKDVKSKSVSAVAIALPSVQSQTESPPVADHADPDYHVHFMPHYESRVDFVIPDKKEREEKLRVASEFGPVVSRLEDSSYGSTLKLQFKYAVDARIAKLVWYGENPKTAIPSALKHADMRRRLSTHPVIVAMKGGKGKEVPVALPPTDREFEQVRSEIERFDTRAVVTKDKSQIHIQLSTPALAQRVYFASRIFELMGDGKHGEDDDTGSRNRPSILVRTRLGYDSDQTELKPDKPPVSASTQAPQPVFAATKPVAAAAAAAASSSVAVPKQPVKPVAPFAQRDPDETEDDEPAQTPAKKIKQEFEDSDVSSVDASQPVPPPDIPASAAAAGDETGDEMSPPPPDIPESSAVAATTTLKPASKIKSISTDAPKSKATDQGDQPGGKKRQKTDTLVYWWGILPDLNSEGAAASIRQDMMRVEQYIGVNSEAPAIKIASLSSVFNRRFQDDEGKLSGHLFWKYLGPGYSLYIAFSPIQEERNATARYPGGFSSQWSRVKTKVGDEEVTQQVRRALAPSVKRLYIQIAVIEFPVDTPDTLQTNVVKNISSRLKNVEFTRGVDVPDKYFRNPTSPLRVASGRSDAIDLSSSPPQSPEKAPAAKSVKPASVSATSISAAAVKPVAPAVSAAGLVAAAVADSKSSKDEKTAESVLQDRDRELERIKRRQLLELELATAELEEREKEAKAAAAAVASRGVSVMEDDDYAAAVDLTLDPPRAASSSSSSLDPVDPRFKMLQEQAAAYQRLEEAKRLADAKRVPPAATVPRAGAASSSSAAAAAASASEPVRKPKPASTPAASLREFNRRENDVENKKIIDAFDRLSLEQIADYKAYSADLPGVVNCRKLDGQAFIDCMKKRFTELTKEQSDAIELQYARSAGKPAAAAAPSSSSAAAAAGGGGGGIKTISPAESARLQAASTKKRAKSTDKKTPKPMNTKGNRTDETSTCCSDSDSSDSDTRPEDELIQAIESMDMKRATELAHSIELHPRYWVIALKKLADTDANYRKGVSMQDMATLIFVIYKRIPKMYPQSFTSTQKAALNSPLTLTGRSAVF